MPCPRRAPPPRATPTATPRGGRARECRARSEESTNLADGVERVVRPPGTPMPRRVRSSLLATHAEAAGIIGIPSAGHPMTGTASAGQGTAHLCTRPDRAQCRWRSAKPTTATYLVFCTNSGDSGALCRAWRTGTACHARRRSDFDSHRFLPRKGSPPHGIGLSQRLTGNHNATVSIDPRGRHHDGRRPRDGVAGAAAAVQCTGSAGAHSDQCASTGSPSAGTGAVLGMSTAVRMPPATKIAVAHQKLVV